MHCPGTTSSTHISTAFETSAIMPMNVNQEHLVHRGSGSHTGTPSVLSTTVWIRSAFWERAQPCPVKLEVVDHLLLITNPAALAAYSPVCNMLWLWVRLGVRYRMELMLGPWSVREHTSCLQTFNLFWLQILCPQNKNRPVSLIWFRLPMCAASVYTNTYCLLQVFH